jgi:hypothetical protein
MSCAFRRGTQKRCLASDSTSWLAPNIERYIYICMWYIHVYIYCVSAYVSLCIRPKVGTAVALQEVLDVYTLIEHCIEFLLLLLDCEMLMIHKHIMRVCLNTLEAGKANSWTTGDSNNDKKNTRILFMRAQVATSTNKLRVCTSAHLSIQAVHMRRFIVIWKRQLRLLDWLLDN